MKQTLKLEILKAFKNKFFVAAILIGCVITFLSFLNAIILTENFNANMADNPTLAMNTLYNNWIGGEVFSLATSLYFFIFPLLIAIPYGWSYCEEKKTGYMKSVVTRSGKRAYFSAKYIAVFLAAGSAMVIPLVFNLVMVAMVVPAVKPEPVYNIYYAVFGKSLMSGLFYSHPLLYEIFYLCIDFVFAGLLAEISLAMSSFIKQKWICVGCPFLVCLMISFARKYVYVSSTTTYKEISPLFFLRPASAMYDADWRIIIGMAAVIFLITFGIIRGWESRREIY